MTTLGIDLGATNTKTVLLSDANDVTVLASFPTGGELGPDGAIRSLIERVLPMVDGHDVEAVGVGTPGLFDPETGIVTLFTNLPGQWIGVPLRA